MSIELAGLVLMEDIRVADLVCGCRVVATGSVAGEVLATLEYHGCWEHSPWCSACGAQGLAVAGPRCLSCGYFL